MQVKTFLSLFLLLFFQACSSLFFYPDQKVYRTPAFYELKYDDVYFESSDKTLLHAWRIHPSSTSKGLVFVAHGNAQNLSAHFVGWTWLIEEGYELFIFDYREYGKSEGESELKGSIEDTKAALDYIQSNYKEKFSVVGQSLGGTLLLNALDGRDNTQIKAVIIDSTFTGFSDIVSNKMSSFFLTWPFQWIPRLSLSDDYDAKDRLQNLDKPILFIHGSLDGLISVNNSWNLFEKASSPRELWIVKEAGHIRGVENVHVQKDFIRYIQETKTYYEPHYSKMKIYE